MEVEALAEEYIELALDPAGSIKLVVDAFANPLRSRLVLRLLTFPGEGIPGATRLSLSFDKLILFAFENSFIFELILFGSFPGAGPGCGAGCGVCCNFGEGSGDRPFGNATLAAVAAVK